MFNHRKKKKYRIPIGTVLRNKNTVVFWLPVGAQQPSQRSVLRTLDYDVDDHWTGIDHPAALAGIGWGGIKAGCWNHLQENPLPCLWVLSCTCQMEHTTLPLRAVWASLRYGWAPRVCVLREGWRDVNHLCSHNFLPNFKGRGNSPPSLDKVSEPQVGSEMRLGQVLERVNISQAAMREQRLYWRS